MEELNNEDCSVSSHNGISLFKELDGILNDSQVGVSDKCISWRQQSIIIRSVENTLVGDLLSRHWVHHSGLVDNSQEFHKTLLSTVGNEERFGNVEFPDIDDIDLPVEPIVDNEIFTVVPDKGSNCNIECEAPRIRNTMGNFLQGYTPTSAESTFVSARQLLTEQSLKKQMKGNGVLNQQSTSSNYLKRPDVGFNFLATKKSLGSLTRVTKVSYKNFASPLCTKCPTPTPDNKSAEIECSENLMSHPALRNIDPKMVELINNEIIQKFQPVDWNDVAGLQYAKSIIKEAVVYPLLRPDIFTGLRRPPKGILLFGPPGTGKTLIGKCIASQSSSTFFSISSASLTSKWLGEGEKMVRTLFAVAVARQPSVIFIDEIDSLLSQRSESENEGTRRLKTEFLVRLDGADTSGEDRVLIVGATNRPQELDEAIRRRFVKRLYVPLPEQDGRAEILTNLLKTIENNLNSSHIEEISRLAEGFSGADMDSLCREAAMEPLRSLPANALMTLQKSNLRYVNIDDFYSALKKIRPSVAQNDLNQYVEWNKTYGSSF